MSAASVVLIEGAWTKAEEIKLWESVKTGFEMDELVKAFGRSEDSIIGKLKLLAWMKLCDEWVLSTDEFVEDMTRRLRGLVSKEELSLYIHYKNSSKPDDISNNGTRWLASQVDELVQQVSVVTNISEIAKHHKRTPHAIVCQILSMAVEKMKLDGSITGAYEQFKWYVSKDEILRTFVSQTSSNSNLSNSIISNSIISNSKINKKRSSSEISSSATDMTLIWELKHFLKDNSIVFDERMHNLFDQFVRSKMSE